MKITQLETFIAVAEELHFRRAAERLYAQPSTVSTTIRQLEAELSVSLFRRDSRKVELTPAGVEFLQRATTILNSVEEAKRAAQGAEEGAAITVTVGIQDEGIAEMTPVFVENYRSRFPNAEVNVRGVSYGETQYALLSGQVDVLFGVFLEHWFREPNDIISEVLWTEQRLIVSAATSPLAEQQTIRLDQILTIPHLYLAEVPDVINDFYFNRSLRDLDRSPDVPIEGQNMTAVLNGVAFSGGIFSATDGTRRFYTRPDVVYIPAPELSLGHMAVAIRRHDDRPHLSALLEEAIRTVETARGLVPSALPVPPDFDPFGTVSPSSR